MRRTLALACAVVTVLASMMIATAGTAAADPSANAWKQLRMCESSNRYDINTGNGYYGAYQFDLSTWRSVGGTGYPDQASPAEQDYRALRLYRMRGWQPWTCAALVGLTEDGDARSGVLPPVPGTSSGAPGSPAPSGSEGSAGSGGPSSAPAWPGRQFFEGDYSEALKVWQKQMGARGYGLVGTGYFGPNTEKAVRDLQSKSGLNVVGFIGPKTWAAAWAVSGSSSSAPYAPATDASCQVGATTAPAWPGETYLYGQTARNLQCFQRELGHRGYGLTGSGYYGDNTKAAVLDLQRRNGLDPSGTIGPSTWKAAWEGKTR